MIGSERSTETDMNSFNRAYSSMITHWIWTDTRIPDELRELASRPRIKTALEFGCGLGRFTAYLARQGIAASGVDFSEVAIEKAKQRWDEPWGQPTFMVGDVTNLSNLQEPFDAAVDIGCFHCLNEAQQRQYAAEAHRLLKPGATLLLWALDHSPSEIQLGPEAMARTFSNGFELIHSTFSRRRLIASHWYWFSAVW